MSVSTTTRTPQPTPLVGETFAAIYDMRQEIGRKIEQILTRFDPVALVLGLPNRETRVLREEIAELERGILAAINVRARTLPTMLEVPTLSTFPPGLVQLMASYL